MINNFSFNINGVEIIEERMTYSELAYKALRGDLIAKEILENVADAKKLCIYEFISTLVTVSAEREIFYGTVDNIPIIIDGLRDKIYRDGRGRRELKVIAGELYALDKKKGLVKIYNTAGEFDFSIVKFASGNTTSGSKGYKSIRLCTKKYGKVKVRSHLFAAAVLFRTEALDCIGYDRIFEVNHKDCDHKNNRFINLEKISHKANMEHNARVKYTRAIEKYREFGYITQR